MTLHKYDALIRKIDRSPTSDFLRQYLPKSRVPFVLARPSTSFQKEVLFLSEQLAIRTAKGFQSFNSPAIAERLTWPTSTGLRWLRKVSEREFVFCVGLQKTTRRYLEAHSRGEQVLRTKREKAHGFSYLLNTDDNSLVFDALNDINVDLDGPDYHPSSSSSSGDRGNSKEEVERLLLKEDVNMEELPLDLALEILRPQQPLLDILVNETSIRSNTENCWFSLFFRNHVGWRVLQEHLLHRINPELYPQIVNPDTNIVDLIQDAADEVVRIFSAIDSNSSSSLTIHIDEHADLSKRTPDGVLFSSCAQCPCTSIAVNPPVSSTVYSVVGHYSYIFREILKNACAASLRARRDAEIVIRHSMDDRWIVLDFEDTAGGIELEHGKQVWKFGWSTSEHFESHLAGFGVGLSTSKMYADMWGGAIDVYTRVGVGTTVRVRLPKSPTESWDN